MSYVGTVLPHDVYGLHNGMLLYQACQGGLHTMPLRREANVLDGKQVLIGQWVRASNLDTVRYTSSKAGSSEEAV